MLNVNKITQLATLLLPLCTHMSQAQHWSDEEMKKDLQDQCDPGLEWTTWETGPLKAKTGSAGSGNAPKDWTKTGGDPQLLSPNSDGGVYLPLTEQTEPKYLAYQSDSRWSRPMFVKMRFQSTGAPGIVSALNFTEAGATGKAEVHFMAVSLETQKGPLKHYLSIPHFAPRDESGLRNLTTGGDNAEVRIELAGGTTYATDTSDSENFDVDGEEGAKLVGFQQNWGITWAGFDPTSEENVYGFKLLKGSTEWYAGNQWTDMPLRMKVHETTKNDIYPRGPLPFSFGPSLSTEDWAGTANWQKIPKPTMLMYDLVVSGCKEISFSS